MYCMNCGHEMPDTAKVCPACGTRVGAFGEAGLAGAASAPAVDAPIRHDSYEYARTTVASDLATVATDCYESLGFELTSAKNAPTGGTTVLAFRRSRKVRGKAQLAKLQRTADDLIAQLADLDREKTRGAAVRALSMGIVSALVLGVGMCCTMVWTQFMVLGVIVGLVGIAGCVATWFLYRATVRKDTARLAPRVEAAYDQLATVCEEAQSVLAL